MSTIFKPTSVNNLYALEDATGWIGYLFPKESTLKPLSITLEDSLNKQNYDGIYIFASETPDFTNSNFSNTIWQFLNKNHSSTGVFNERCFLWLNLNLNSPELGFGQTIVFRKINYMATSKAINYDQNSQHLLVNDSIFMAIPPYSEVSITNNSITIARQATSISKSFKYGMYLTNTDTNKSIRLGNIDSRGVSIEAPITIPMSGKNRGCLQFELSFPFTYANPRYFPYGHDLYPYTYSGNEQDEYTILETGIKYYFLDKINKGDTEMMYFLFKQETASGFKGSFDFSDLFNTKNTVRTYFAFTGKNIINQKESGTTTLPSNFQTNFGKEIQLTPVSNFLADGSPAPDSALLVFSDAVLMEANNKKRYYWTVQGDFIFESTSSNSKEEMLLCGISGTETINYTPKTTKYAGDRISFTPKQPAYSSQFLDLEKLAIKTTDTLLLTDKYTTAWANVIKATTSQGTANSYYSQPNQAPLFQQGVTNGTLDYAEIPSANLIALVEEKGSFPIATSAKSTPVLGKVIEGQLGFYTQKNIQFFEIEILNPSRKKTISEYYKFYLKNKVKIQASQENACPIENLTTTPQGFLVNLNSDKTEWKCLTLANNESTTNKLQNKAAIPVAPVPLRFKEIDASNSITGLQSAFQTNEQFLVISNPIKSNKDLLDYYTKNFQNQISVADWPFLLDIAHQNKDSNTNAEFTNIMIFKFCNKSIEERIADPSLWTDPTIFNDDKKIPQLIKWIQDYIETARKSIVSSKGSTESQGFQKFINIIESKTWSGVLSLQVTLNLKSLPSEIKAILAGIDTSRFAAHHLGIESNQIKTKDNNQLDTNFKSSLFGMISYFNSTYLAYQNGTKTRPIVAPKTFGSFDFQVLDLQVIFKNSLISDFKSKIQLNMNDAFDEPVIKESFRSDDAIYKNSIIMNGQYDKKNGSTSYTFSLTNQNSLTVASTALDVVTITGIEMSTIDDVPKTNKLTANVNGETITKPAQNAQITTRFTIAGNLQFQEIDECDLFSYNKLIFSNLFLDMKFNLNDINTIDKTPKKAFTFLPNNIVFNKSNSTTRPKSLVPNFPIKLDNLIYYNPINNPENKSITTSSLDYMQVEAPLPTAPVGKIWYALRFNLNMGSLGALASKVGFNSEIILAWSPGKGNNQAQIYAKMPFSGGVAGSNFSINGVLKFAIGSILLFNAPPSPDTKTRQYSMVFTQVGVSLLGQKLPPSGSTVFYLFGNPNDPSADVSGKSNLGWFGAYKSDKAKKESEETQKKITV